MIELTSKPHRITSIKKKTNAVLFRDMEVGNVIQFTARMQRAAKASGGGVHATVVKVSNLTKGTYDRSKSQTEVTKILEQCFELEVVE